MILAPLHYASEPTVAVGGEAEASKMQPKIDEVKAHNN